MKTLHDIHQGENIADIAEIIKNATIFDKIEFSCITKEQITEKIHDLETRQVPEREVLLNMSDDAVAEYWLKNWLHPMLKHACPSSPKDKRGCSREVIMQEIKQDQIRFYENSQQNYDYTLDDIKAWLEES